MHIVDTWQVEQGRLAVGTIYLGGGVCGALGASLLQPNLYLVGASAGVYALLTSHLAHLYLVSNSLMASGLRRPQDAKTRCANRASMINLASVVEACKQKCK
jgi:hypothetical protein